jgi:trafficking protein particle complex subunit 10
VTVLADVPLKDENATTPTNEEINVLLPFSVKGILFEELRSSITNPEEFRKLYENISDQVVKHYGVAGRTKAMESVLGDLAAIKFEIEDYAAASMYFSRMANTFAQDRWGFVELTLLKMYAQCQKKLGREKEHIGALLDIVAKCCARLRMTRSNGMRTSAIGRSGGNWLDDEAFETTGFLTELLEALDEAHDEIVVPLAKYFGDVSIDPLVRHYEDRDGFRLQMQFRHLLEDEVTIDRAKARLVSTAPIHTKEIWLEAANVVHLRQGVAQITLDSNVRQTPQGLLH